MADQKAEVVAQAKGDTPEEVLTDPSPRVNRDGEILAAPPSYMKGLTIITDTASLIERSLNRIMNATTAEEALSDPESAGLRDYSGKVITIVGVVGIMPSAIKTSDFYLIFEARTKVGGGVETLTTGSPYAASRIIKCAAEGWLPRRVLVMELESTSNPGQSSLWIVDAPGGSEANADDQPY